MIRNSTIRCLYYSIALLISTAWGQSQWTWRNPLPQGDDLFRVLWTGSSAMGFTRTGIAITSPDGMTWTSQRIGTGLYIMDAAWAGNFCVAVDNKGLAYRSADGQNWETVNTGSTASITSIVWTGANLVAVGSGGRVFLSNNGRDWTINRLADTATYLTKICWSGSQLVALGNGTDEIFTSINGNSWTRQSTGTANRFLDMVWNNDLAVIVGSAIMSSPDCSTWTLRDSGSQKNLCSITWASDEFIAVGTGAIQYTSSDGIVWNNYSWCSGPWPRDFYKVAWTGSHAYLIGEEEMFAIKSGPSAWGKCGAYGASSLRDVTSAGPNAVIVGDRGQILCGPDGSNPDSRLTGVTNDLTNGKWTGMCLVAMGKSGTILTSPDGTAWSVESTKTRATINDIVWTGTRHVAVGDSGTILTSPDTGTTWTKSTSNTAVHLRKVIWTGQYLLAIGSYGTICRSLNGITWFRDTMPAPRRDLVDIAWSGTRAVAIAGSGDTYVSENCSTWTYHQIGFVEPLTKIIWTGNTFVVTAYWKMIATSTDGTLWTERSRRGPNLLDIVWTGEQLVAVGNQGFITTSPDGSQWTTRDSNNTAIGDIKKIVWTGSQLIALTTRQIRTSINGIVWNGQVLPTQHQQNALVCNEQSLILFGNYGTILTSPEDDPSAIRPRKFNGEFTRSIISSEMPRLICSNGHLQVPSVFGSGAETTHWSIYGINGRAIISGEVHSPGAFTIRLPRIPQGTYLFVSRTPESRRAMVFLNY